MNNKLINKSSKKDFRLLLDKLYHQLEIQNHQKKENLVIKQNH